MFSGVPNGPLRLSPPQVHAAVHNSGDTNITMQAAEIDSHVLLERMNEILSSPVAAGMEGKPAFQNGVAGVAQRLAERIETLSAKAASTEA